MGKNNKTYIHKATVIVCCINMWKDISDCFDVITLPNISIANISTSHKNLVEMCRYWNSINFIFDPTNSKKDTLIIRRRFFLQGLIPKLL